MTIKADFYGLCMDKSKSCFLTFDPSDYTEVRGYQANPVFHNDEMHAWLDKANDALTCFTRGMQYESEVGEIP